MIFVIIVFVVIVGMIFILSIVDGIVFGFIVYILIKFVCGEYKDVYLIIYGLSVLFVVYFILIVNFI